MRILNFCFFVFLLIFCLKSSSAQKLEYFAKASYIEKFSRFTAWPSATNKDSFLIVVFGKSPIESTLNQMVRKISIKSKPVKIKYTIHLTELQYAQVVFIAKNENQHILEVLNQLKNKPILSISEIDDFCKKGGHINFYDSEQGSIYFEINPTSLKASGLKVDMYMLEFGKIINQ